MAARQIKKYPDKALRRKARRVKAVTEVEKGELSDMAETMYLNQGIGLAAIQVGIEKEMIVIDMDENLLKMVNPTITNKTAGCETQEEGCLSVLGHQIKIRRAKGVTVQYLDEEGAPAEIKAEGLLARVVQHEVDHLAGKLIIDYVSPLKRLLKRFLLKKQLDKVRKIMI